MFDILLTNDDGYQAPGFYHILKELSKNYKVFAIAPDNQKSWIGKSITANIPLTLNKTRLNEFEIYTLSGTPADCIQLGIYNILEENPRFIVSGINDGPNLDRGRILSSGTLGACFEGAIANIKGIGISLYIPQNTNNETAIYNLFKKTASITSKIIKKIFSLDYKDLPEITSINFPFEFDENTKIEIISKINKQSYKKLFELKEDKYYHQRPYVDFNDVEEKSDLEALKNNKISITPISLSLIEKKNIDFLKNVFNNCSLT